MSWATEAFAAGGACEVKRQARRRVAERDGWSCRYCGRALAQPPRGTIPTAAERASMATLEHLTPPPRQRPRAWQDCADLANLGISCAPCNEDKANLTEAEYRLVLAYRRLVGRASA